ncbi:hypothetical protein J6590_013986 [Homalodisca vitripennis]|nr:hypothetical protein J6590_013986 [Homalodisca vitripennis]
MLHADYTFQVVELVNGVEVVELSRPLSRPYRVFKSGASHVPSFRKLNADSVSTIPTDKIISSDTFRDFLIPVYRPHTDDESFRCSLFRQIDFQRNAWEWECLPGEGGRGKSTLYKVSCLAVAISPPAALSPPPSPVFTFCPHIPS